jgi:hypothetical protein
MSIEKRLKNCIKAYDRVVKGIDTAALESDDRAYGGIIWAGKGKLVESLAEALVETAWCSVLGQSKKRLEMNRSKMKIHLKDGYIDRIEDPKVRDYLIKNNNKIVYKFGTDVHVYIDGKLIMPIECKAYTENAMMKRILFDAVLMKEAKGLDKYYLLQLESQLGGDYSLLNEITYGSPATHVLMSHVDVDLEIITLLKGERRVKRPIHKQEFYKPLHYEALERAVNIFATDLERYAK